MAKKDLIEGSRKKWSSRRKKGTIAVICNKLANNNIESKYCPKNIAKSKGRPSKSPISKSPVKKKFA